MILTVPNVLTMSRMLMTPILGYLVVYESYTMACIVFIAAGITDLVGVLFLFSPLNFKMLHMIPIVNILSHSRAST